MFLPPSPLIGFVCFVAAAAAIGPRTYFAAAAATIAATAIDPLSFSAITAGDLHYCWFFTSFVIRLSTLS